jgi:prevent-host-death family protein
MAKALKPAQRQTMGVTDFKARCLELLDGVGARGDEIIITKRGKPIAQIGPIRHEAEALKGLFAGRMTITGDIVNVNWADDWEANR